MISVLCALCIFLLQMKHFGYIYCTERLVLENKLEKWGDCFEMVGLSRAAFDCYINGYGNQVNLADTKVKGLTYKSINWQIKQ